MAEDRRRAAGKIKPRQVAHHDGSQPHHEWRGYASDYRFADGVLDCARLVLTDRIASNLDLAGLWLGLGLGRVSEALSG